jgi:hypothetical protein
MALDTKSSTPLKQNPITESEPGEGSFQSLLLFFGDYTVRSYFDGTILL